MPVLVTDARTGCDSMNSESLPKDRKIATDVGLLRQGLFEDSSGCQVRGVLELKARCRETV